jgi:hypothetical protein
MVVKMGVFKDAEIIDRKSSTAADALTACYSEVNAVTAVD